MFSTTTPASEKRQVSYSSLGGLTNQLQSPYDSVASAHSMHPVNEALKAADGGAMPAASAGSLTTLRESLIPPTDKPVPTASNAMVPVVDEKKAHDPFSEDWSYKKVCIKFNRRAFPFALSRMTDIAGDIISGYLFSRLAKENADLGEKPDPKYLAASGLIIASNRLFISSILASFFSLPPLYNRCKSDPLQVGTLIRQAFTGAIALTGVAAPILLTSGFILKEFGVESNAAHLVEEYYLGGALMIPLTFISGVVRQSTLLLGGQKISLLLSIMNNACSLGIGSLFMFGLGGAPKLGVLGLGLGASLTAVPVLISYWLFFKHNPEFQQYQFFRPGFGDLRGFSRIPLEASPFSVQIAADTGVDYVANVLAARLGNPQESAARIAEMVYVAPYMAMVMYPQTTAFFGNAAMGCKNFRLMNKVFNVNILSMVALDGAWMLAACLAMDPIIKLFTSDSHENSLSRPLFYIIPAILVAELVKFAAAAGLRVFRDYKISMWNSLIWGALLGNGATILGYKLGDSLTWVYGGRAIAMGAGGASLLYQYYKKRNVVIEEILANSAAVEAPYQAASAQAPAALPALTNTNDEKMSNAEKTTVAPGVAVKIDMPNNARAGVSSAGMVGEATKIHERVRLVASAKTDTAISVARSPYSSFNARGRAGSVQHNANVAQPVVTTPLLDNTSEATSSRSWCTVM